MKINTKSLLLALGLSFLLFTACPGFIGGEDPEDTDPADTDITTNDDTGTSTNDDDDTTTTEPALEVVQKSGTISTDETWDGDKVYYVSGDIILEAAISIEAGCIVKIAPGKDIKTQNGGKITAIGTATNRIYFTSRNDDAKGGALSASNGLAEQQDWDAIKIDENSVGSIFQFCTFEYGDSTLEIIDGDVEITITDNVFDKNYYGLTAKYGLTDSVIERNRFYLNKYPILMDATLSLGNTNMFTNEDGSLENTYQRITFHTYGSSLIDKSVIFEETEVPFNGGYAGFEIYANATLTISSGVVVTMNEGADITIKYGSDLILQDGSIITSTEDGSLDGSSTVDSDDYWDGIREQASEGSSSYTYKTYDTGVYFSENSSL